jgi:hypothetical protein
MKARSPESPLKRVYRLATDQDVSSSFEDNRQLEKEAFSLLPGTHPAAQAW